MTPTTSPRWRPAVRTPSKAALTLAMSLVTAGGAVGIAVAQSGPGRDHSTPTSVSSPAADNASPSDDAVTHDAADDNGQDASPSATPSMSATPRPERHHDE